MEQTIFEITQTANDGSMKGIRYCRKMRISNKAIDTFKYLGIDKVA